MEDKELAKMFNLTLKMREAILFFLIVMINGPICIRENIWLDTFRNNFHIHWWVNDVFIMENKELFTHLMD